ncbi:MAG: squalene synthase HpnC [Candidatus Omnitrophica bacterium]|nr:squalene synthase HpnC [Candidatus Omnitrophota bacterium]
MDRVLSDAYRYCEWINTHHYENFPVGSWLLSARVRPHVSAVYAFARTADDFADERKYQGRSLELLSRWRASLKNLTPVPGTNPPFGTRYQTPLWYQVPNRPPVPGTEFGSHPIFLALADTVRRFDLPVQLLDDLLTAFTMDVTKKRYADWEELMTYCRYSANPVGRLVLLLCGIRDPERHALSDSICSGLQLANHWQNLAQDAARDMLYVPQDLMKRHGVSEEELIKLSVRAEPVEAQTARPSTSSGRTGMTSPQFVALMRELVARARALFDAGEPLVGKLSGGLRLEIKLTALGGRAILDRIERAGYDVFRDRPVLSGLEKARLLTHAILR